MTIVRTVTPAGEAIVILPEAEFERLRILAEDAVDLHAIDASEHRLAEGADELLSEADLDTLRAAPSALSFWRTRRNVPLERLARDGGVTVESLTALEAGNGTAEDAVYDRLAHVLGVDAEDITP